MPKAPRHRKRVRTARLAATAAPLGGAAPSGDAASSSAVTNGSASSAVAAKKVGKKEAEVTNLVDKLRSAVVEERVWASTALSGQVLEMPDVTLRLLLSKNLIGLLIERLNDPEDQVVVECLGTLRNLAITQPPSLLSEMHNKRLLHPLTNTLLPLLLSHLPSQLAPFVPQTPSLPASPEDRQAVDLTNAKAEQRRAVYWDLCENVLVLLSCLAESTTKILGSLNAHGGEIVGLCKAFLASDMLGLEGNVAKGKGRKTKERVPLNVALAAAQTIHSFLSSNPSSHPHLTSALPSLSKILSTPKLPFTATDDEATDFAQLRVLAFGILLGRRDRDKELLGGNVAVLTGLLGTELEQVAQEAKSSVARVGIEAPSNPELIKIEKKLSTLQLSLEVLGEWCASLDLKAKPIASSRPSAASAGVDEDEEEEWGGIVDADGDAEMDEDVEEEDDEEIIQKKLEDEDDDEMEDDEDPEAEERLPLSNDTRELCASLPEVLLRLTAPISVSFVSASSSSAAPSAPEGLISTSAAPTGPSSPPLPAPLSAVSETITTIHVRALECLNNLFITIASSGPSGSEMVKPAVAQKVWEGVLEGVQRAGTVSSVEESEEVKERKKEFVSAGAGVAWGVTRVGLDNGLVVGPSTTPFLIELFSHPFASEATPAGESVRVRIAGVLGCIGRRSGIEVAENATIGQFLLSILPLGKTQSPLAPTADVLIQAIDAVIDLYADEDSTWDKAVFRAGGFLERLESSVQGVRAATKKIDRKKFPELRLRADGALENLVAFVQYRKDVA